MNKPRISIPLASDPAPILTYAQYNNPLIVQPRKFDKRHKTLVLRDQERMRENAKQFYRDRPFN